jgi:hypothetical protein
MTTMYTCASVTISCRENRYVLFLTENYAALDILKNPKNYLSSEMNMSRPGARTAELATEGSQTRDIQPFILFGSSFPKDKEYTQVCIFNCMAHCCGNEDCIEYIGLSEY